MSPCSRYVGTGLLFIVLWYILPSLTQSNLGVRYDPMLYGVLFLFLVISLGSLDSFS